MLSYKEGNREEDQDGLRRPETHLWCPQVSMSPLASQPGTDPDQQTVRGFRKRALDCTSRLWPSQQRPQEQGVSVGAELLWDHLPPAPAADTWNIVYTHPFLVVKASILNSPCLTFVKFCLKFNPNLSYSSPIYLTVRLYNSQKAARFPI